MIDARGNQSSSPESDRFQAWQSRLSNKVSGVHPTVQFSLGLPGTYW